MSPTTSPINFAETPLDNYAGSYATVLDDVFTHEECVSLLKLATASESWVHAGLRDGTVHKKFRNSWHITYVDPKASMMIYERLRPLVEKEIREIKVGGQWEGITGKMGRKQGPTWRLTGVNPRLSFLRYGPGEYFKPHCDGLNDLVRGDGSLTKSFVTLHLYLNGCEGNDVPVPEDPIHANIESAAAVGDDPDLPLEGGATRFWTPNKKYFMDVLPRVGRVLVFQQRMLVHSGEEVTQGIKYTMRSDFMFEQAA